MSMTQFRPKDRPVYAVQWFEPDDPRHSTDTPVKHEDRGVLDDERAFKDAGDDDPADADTIADGDIGWSAKKVRHGVTCGECGNPKDVVEEREFWIRMNNSTGRLLSPGDWIVRDAGRLRVLMPHEFEINYEALQPELPLAPRPPLEDA